MIHEVLTALKALAEQMLSEVSMTAKDQSSRVRMSVMSRQTKLMFQTCVVEVS